MNPRRFLLGLKKKSCAKNHQEYQKHYLL
ncbi:hypothetical protein MP638_003993 [Amoeboaphelidium occidentale]|nr:hypothetical protein MP638_003993 [Amoeboaphelidium occidentale]